jgi:hypothetical protein
MVSVLSQEEMPIGNNSPETGSFRFRPPNFSFDQHKQSANRCNHAVESRGMWGVIRVGWGRTVVRVGKLSKSPFGIKAKMAG